MADLPVQQVVVITGILAETGNKKVTLRTTISSIKMISFALIVWLVFRSTPFSTPLTVITVRTPQPLKSYSFQYAKLVLGDVCEEVCNRAIFFSELQRELDLAFTEVDYLYYLNMLGTYQITRPLIKL